MTAETEKFEVKEPSGHYHSLKRTSLLFSCAVLLTFSGVKIDEHVTILGFNFISVTIDLIRWSLWLAGTYYLYNFVFEFRHFLGQNNDLARRQGEIDSAIEEALNQNKEIQMALSNALERQTGGALESDILTMNALVDPKSLNLKIKELENEFGEMAKHLARNCASLIAEETSTELQRLGMQQNPAYLPSDNLTKRSKELEDSFLSSIKGEFENVAIPGLNGLVENYLQPIKDNSEALTKKISKIPSEIPESAIIKDLIQIELVRISKRIRAVSARFVKDRLTQIYVLDLVAPCISWFSGSIFMLVWIMPKWEIWNVYFHVTLWVNSLDLQNLPLRWLATFGFLLAIVLISVNLFADWVPEAYKLLKRTIRDRITAALAKIMVRK